MGNLTVQHMLQIWNLVLNVCVIMLDGPTKSKEKQFQLTDPSLHTLATNLLEFAAKSFHGKNNIPC